MDVKRGWYARGNSTDLKATDSLLYTLSGRCEVDISTLKPEFLDEREFAVGVQTDSTGHDRMSAYSTTEGSQSEHQDQVCALPRSCQEIRKYCVMMMIYLE